MCALAVYFCELSIVTGPFWCRGAKGRQVFDRGGDDCDDDRVRIPLRDVIRFKERQWFIEEVEVRTARHFSLLVLVVGLQAGTRDEIRQPAFLHGTSGNAAPRQHRWLLTYPLAGGMQLIRGCQLTFAAMYPV